MPLPVLLLLLLPHLFVCSLGSIDSIRCRSRTPGHSTMAYVGIPPASFCCLDNRTRVFYRQASRHPAWFGAPEGRLADTVAAHPNFGMAPQQQQQQQHQQQPVSSSIVFCRDSSSRMTLGTVSFKDAMQRGRKRTPTNPLQRWSGSRRVASSNYG